MVTPEEAVRNGAAQVIEEVSVWEGSKLLELADETLAHEEADTAWEAAETEARNTDTLAGPFAVGGTTRDGGPWVVVRVCEPSVSVHVFSVIGNSHLPAHLQRVSRPAPAPDTQTVGV